jgi:hypothetical protein
LDFTHAAGDKRKFVVLVDRDEIQIGRAVFMPVPDVHDRVRQGGESHTCISPQQQMTVTFREFRPIAEFKRPPHDLQPSPFVVDRIQQQPRILHGQHQGGTGNHGGR